MPAGDEDDEDDPEKGETPPPRPAPKMPLKGGLGDRQRSKR
jgi:hypothetical protein